MAIVISDTNDKRKQVDLKLGKVSLTPTIQAQSGPATRVQDISPIVRQGEQFLNNFNNLTKVYGDAVDVFTEQGKEEAKQLDEAGFQDALKNISGDSFSLFGKTKAFNEGLVERYFATEVPLELQKIDQEMQANITQYGSLDKFQEATAKRLDTYFNSLGDKFDENVFTNRALGAYSSVVKQKELLASNTKYLQKIDEFNTEEANNKAYRAIDGLKTRVDVAQSLEETLTLVDNKISETITEPSERNKTLTGAVFGKLENAIDNQEFEYADEMLDLIEDEEFAINGKQIFNTSEAGLRVETLRAKYETAKRNYERNQLPLDRARGTSAAMLEITSAIRNQGEEVGVAVANKYLDEIAKTGSITIGDETYTDPIIVADIQKEIRAATFNPQVFVKLADDRLMDASSTNIRRYTEGILEDKQIRGILANNGIDESLFYIEQVDESGLSTSLYHSTDLSAIRNEVRTYERELVQDIIENIPADITQPNDKALYVEQQIQELGIQDLLKERLIERIKNYVPEKTAEVDIITLEKDLITLGVDKKTINSIKKDNPNAKAELEELRRIKDASSSNYSLNNGKVETEGFFYNSRLESFKQAEENDAWVDSENKLDNQEILVRKAEVFGKSENRINEDGIKIKGDLNDKIEGYNAIYDNHLSVVGVNTDELLNGYTIKEAESYGLGKTFISYSTVRVGDLMKRVNKSFSDFGIRLGDKKSSFRNTIRAIEAFENNGTVDPSMQSIANKYGITVSDLYAQQKQYFEQNGYL